MPPRASSRHHQNFEVGVASLESVVFKKLEFVNITNLKSPLQSSTQVHVFLNVMINLHKMKKYIPFDIFMI